jgi:hypothetical protein
MAFSFLGERHDISGAQAREILRIPHSSNKIHSICFPDAEPPRHAHTGVLPPVEDMRPCFQRDFGEGLRRLPTDLTTTACALDSIVKRTILPREGFTRLQQWIVSHLVRQIEFDIWDIMLCDIEDVIYGSFKTTRHMHYAHWFTYLIFRLCGPLPESVIQEHAMTTHESQYDASQLLRFATRVTPIQ